MSRGLCTSNGLGKPGSFPIYGLSLAAPQDDPALLTLFKVLYTGAFQPVGVLLARAPMGVHQWDITFRQFGRYLFVCSIFVNVRRFFLILLSFNTVCWSSGELSFSCSRSLSSCNTSVSSSQLAPATSHSGRHTSSCMPTLRTMSPSHSFRSFLVLRGRSSGTRQSFKATASTYLR